MCACVRACVRACVLVWHTCVCVCVCVCVVLKLNHTTSFCAVSITASVPGIKSMFVAKQILLHKTELLGISRFNLSHSPR